jgi:hypothetical protein
MGNLPEPDDNIASGKEEEAPDLYERRLSQMRTAQKLEQARKQRLGLY